MTELQLKEMESVLQALNKYSPSIAESWRTMESTNPKHSNEDCRYFVTGTPEGWQPDPFAAYICLGIWTHEGVTIKEIADFIAMCRKFVPDAIKEIRHLRTLVEDSYCEGWSDYGSTSHDCRIGRIDMWEQSTTKEILEQE